MKKKAGVTKSYSRLKPDAISRFSRIIRSEHPKRPRCGAKAV